MSTSSDHYYEESIAKPHYDSIRKEIAAHLGISEEEVDGLDWDVHPSLSREGMIYGWYVEFLSDLDDEILERIGSPNGSFFLEHSYADDTADYDDYLAYEEELRWKSESEDHFKIFRKTLNNIESLSSVVVPEDSKFSMQVMLFMHLISATERLLQSNFMHEVIASEKYTRNFVENDHDLKERKVSLGDIYKAHGNIKETVTKRISQILFHRIRIIGGLYDKVFDLQLGELQWLQEAIKKRHDCAHRAGYTKEGDPIQISDNEIHNTLKSCRELGSLIENHFRSQKSIIGNEDDPM